MADSTPEPARPALTAQLGVSRGSFSLAVDFSVAAGEVLALLGPNGAGKSTTVAALAGLVPLTSGRVLLDGVPLEAPDNGVRVPASRRPVGVVFQDYLLFPHLTVLDNVAFGLRSAGTPRRSARAAAADWLDRVGLGEATGQRPSALSGGQAQRVALVRALAVRPRLLLLDEPLAALDAGTRAHVRSDLRRQLADFAGCTVLVTHDPVDAMVLADRVVVLEAGRAVQAGSPAEVARRPRTDYVARLAGLNLYRGTAAGGRVRLDGGGWLTAVGAGGSAAATADGPPLAGPVLAAVRPAAVAVHRQRPEGSPRNVWSGTVGGLELHGDRVRVQVEGDPPVLADVTPAAVSELGLTAGAAVWVSVKATEIDVYRG